MFDNNMKSIVIVLFMVIICIAQVYGQCPQTLNAAHMCVPGVYTGERVFIDTTTYNTLVNNCSCTFTTTSNVLKLVTYVAPNYAQCNSAIRLQSESGNNMRFECLISGTYLDTSMYKTGEATFEKYADYYDNNYCLMLEVAGQPTDLVTVTCTADIPPELLELSSTQTSAPPIDMTSSDPTSTKSDMFPVFKTESTTYIPELTTLPEVTLNTKNEPVLRSTETTVTNASVQVDATTTNDTVATENVDTVNETVLNVQGTSNPNVTTTLDLFQQSKEIPILLTTTKNMETSTPKNNTFADLTTVIPEVDVNNTMTEQTTNHTLTFGTTQDVTTNTNESTEPTNLTEAKINAIVQGMSFTSSPHADRNQSAANTSVVNNNTIIPDSPMTTPLAMNANMSSDSLSEMTTETLPNRSTVSETEDITTGTPRNGTNIVTAIVTGTVLFNSGGENSSKIIQTIDNVPKYVLGDALNKTDTQKTQPTSNYDITFGSNNADKPYHSNMLDISSPSSSLFSENIAPVTPPTDLSNTLILIPDQPDAISNSTVNETDTVGPSGNSFVEANRGIISFIDNNVPIKSSPFTASEPRVVTENAEPLNPIAMLTDTTMSNVLTNVTDLSTGELNPFNKSINNTSSNLTSTLGLTEAPVITDVNTVPGADTFWKTPPGFDNTVSPFFATGPTPFYDASSTPAETASLSTQATSSPQTIQKIQDPMPAADASPSDMHNNLQDAGMVLPTDSKISQVKNITSLKKNSTQTLTENNFLTNASLNEPFVSNSSMELNNNFQNQDMIPSTVSNIPDNTNNISSETTSTHNPTENDFITYKSLTNNFQDASMVLSRDSKIPDVTNTISSETTTIKVPTENYFPTNEGLSEPFISNSSLDSNDNFQVAGTVMTTDSKISEVTNNVSSETTSGQTPTENYFLTNEGLTEPFVNNSSFDLNNNFQDTGMVMSTDSKLPEVTHNVYSETTTTNVPTENFVLTNEGLNNNIQDTGMSLSTDSMISEVTHNASSETTTIKVSSENYFLSNEGLNETFVNNSSPDLNNNFQDTGMMLSTDSNIRDNSNDTSTDTSNAKTPTENYFLTNEPFVSNSRLDLNNNFQDTGLMMSTDSKLPEVTNNVYSKTTTNQVPTENYFLTNEGLNNKSQDAGIEQSTDVTISEVQTKVSSETTTTQVPTENYFLTNEGLNEPFVNYPSLDLNNNFQQTGMMISTDSNLPEVTHKVYSETTSAQTPTANYFLTNEGVGGPFDNTYSPVSTNTVESIPNNENKTLDTISFGEPPKRIHISEYMDSNVSSSNIEQTPLNSNLPGNQIETNTTRSTIVDELSLGESSKAANISESMNSNVSDSNIEPSTNFWNLLGSQNETDAGAVTVDQISLGEPPAGVHMSEYLNNNISDSNVEHTTVHWDLPGILNETVTADKILFSGPPNGVHLSEYVNNNMSDTAIENTTTNGYFQGEQVAPTMAQDVGYGEFINVGTQTDTFTDAGAVTTDQISFGDPPKRVHISEYMNSSLPDSNVEHTTAGSDLQESQTRAVTDAGAVTADQISFGDPPKRVHISEYMNNNTSDLNVEQTTAGSDLQESQTGSVTDASAMTADQISFGEPPKRVHISEYITSIMSDSKVEQTTAGSGLQESQTRAVTDAGAVTADQISFGEPPKRVHISEYANNNMQETTTEFATNSGGLQGEQVAFGEAQGVGNTEGVSVLSSFAQETTTSSVDSSVQSTANIISEEIVPIENISNESILPMTNTNVETNKDAAMAANILSDIEKLALEENRNVGNHATPIDPTVPVVSDNQLDSNMLQSAVDILSEIEKQVIMDDTNGGEATSTSAPVVKSDITTGASSNKPTGPIENLVEPAPEHNETSFNKPTGTIENLVEPAPEQNVASSNKATGPIENLVEPAPEQNVEWSVDKSTSNKDVDNAYNNVPTTPRQKSFNIVEETMVVTEGPRTVEIGNSKSGDKEMNVSFDKERRGSPLDVNNNTYIIVVGIIAGLVVLATVIGIICHNKRKRRSEKVNISAANIDPASHQNRAFDNEANDPEQGTSVAENKPESSPSNGESSHLPPKAQEY